MHFSLLIAFFSVYSSISVFYQKKITWYHLMKMNTYLADVILMPKFCLNEKINVYFTKLLFIHISLYE